MKIVLPDSLKLVPYAKAWPVKTDGGTTSINLGNATASNDLSFEVAIADESKLPVRISHLLFS